MLKWFPTRGAVRCAVFAVADHSGGCAALVISIPRPCLARPPHVGGAVVRCLQPQKARCGAEVIFCWHIGHLDEIIHARGWAGAAPLARGLRCRSRLRVRSWRCWLLLVQRLLRELLGPGLTV